MWTERHEEVPRQLLQPYWPEKSTKRRIFDRPAENQPYIEFLRTQKFDSENDEADASSDDDNDNVSSNHEEEYRSDKNDAERMSDVRLFMKGMTGDENRLNYRDQVDQVASFCERASSSKPKTNNGKGGKSVALLDEKRIGSTIAGKNEHCTPYSERLTSQELLEYLSRKRFRADSAKGSASNPLEDEKSDAEKRVVFITDLDSATINALQQRHHAPKSQLYRI